MRSYSQPRFDDMVLALLGDFAEEAEAVDVGQWQSRDIKGDRSKVTWELREASLAIRMPPNEGEAQRVIRPNLPWAEDHFQERVGGKPLNPPPSQAWWPFAQNGNADHKKNDQFSHTYPERFWPKHAGHDFCNCPHSAEMREGKEPGYYSEHWPCSYSGRRGVRFSYGDLDDVIERLRDNLLTRQAYLPIWFPEDTGAPAGERVPCTLGYLFLVRKNTLHMTYHIRSCDFMRHWRDDVYMAVRLAHYVRSQLKISQTAALNFGELTMHIGSFHIFEGDRPMVRHLLKEATMARSQRLLGSFG